MSIHFGPKIPQLFVSAALGDCYYTAGEALLRGLQALVESNVISVGLNTPPVSPANGDSYIIGSSPTGVWSAQANNLAYWSTDNPAVPSGEWEYYTPKNGWAVGSGNALYIFNNGAWATTTLASLSDVSLPSGPSSPVTTQLATAATYAVLGTTVTNSDGAGTVISGGNVGGTTITAGTPPWTLTPPTTVISPVASQALTDLNTAITHYEGLTFIQTLTTADMGTQHSAGAPTGTYYAGNYKSGSSLAISTPIILDAQGSPNAVFVFYATASTITQAIAGTITLANGAQAANVVWVVGSSWTTIGPGAVTVGNILAVSSITLGGGSLAGRALANAAVTMNTATTITAPPSGIPTGAVLTFNGTEFVATVPSSGFANPMTTVGDMIYEGLTGSPAVLGPERLPIGTSGQVLTVVAGVPAWETAAGGGSKFQTAGLGWFLGGQDYSTVGTSGSILTNNVVNVIQVILEVEFVISHVTATTVTGSGAGGWMTCALYSADGNTKLIDAGANFLDTSNHSQWTKQVAVGPVTLPSGIYWFAWGSYDASNGGSVFSHQDSSSMANLLNQWSFPYSSPVPPVRFGSAANAITGGGVMPTTLGTITPFSFGGEPVVPVVMFSV